MPLPESPEPEAFRHFEHDRWQSAASAYHGAFGRLTSQMAEPLLDAAGVAAGTRHLDLASGPGYVAARSHARGARVTGADFSGAMVALARSLHPGPDFREADAEALPFADGSFDAVTMAFLLGHLGRPAAAVAEAFRVLRPGGRLALSWWLPPERTAGFAIVLESVRRHGRMDVGLPAAPPFELFGDPAMLRALLGEAGFEGIEAREVAMTWRVATADELFEAYRDGTARTAGLLRKQAPEALAAIRAEVGYRSRDFVGEGGLALPMPAWLVSAAKP